MRGWRVAVLALPGLLACPGRGMDAVGLSSARGAGGASAGAVDAAAPRVASPVAPDFREHMTRLSPRQLSRGHGEKFDGIVWGNEPATAGWRSGGAMPDGAVLVEEAIERAAKGDRPAGLFFMEKADGAWRFVAVGPEGDVASDARAARCATCHADAPRDDVFRVDQSSATTSAAMTATVPTAVATAAATYDARSAGPADAASSP